MKDLINNITKGMQQSSTLSDGGGSDGLVNHVDNMSEHEFDNLWRKMEHDSRNEQVQHDHYVHRRK